MVAIVLLRDHECLCQKKGWKDKWPWWLPECLLPTISSTWRPSKFLMMMVQSKQLRNKVIKALLKLLWKPYLILSRAIDVMGFRNGRLSFDLRLWRRVWSFFIACVWFLAIYQPWCQLLVLKRAELAASNPSQINTQLYRGHLSLQLDNWTLLEFPAKSPKKILKM